MSITLRNAVSVFALGAATIATVGCQSRVEERRDDIAARPIGEVERTPTDVTRPMDPVNREMGTLGRDPVNNNPLDERTNANNPAIQSLATARCEREQTCNNVGVDKKWATRDACMADLSKDLQDDLNLSECPGGIVQKELDECLAEIKNENCDNPLDTIGRLAACRESDLCKALDLN